MHAGLGRARLAKTGVAGALILSCLAFASGAATAGTGEGEQACMNDAFAICPQFIPDRERVAGCLISNRSRISPACRTALTHFNPLVSRAKFTTMR